MYMNTYCHKIIDKGDGTFDCTISELDGDGPHYAIVKEYNARSQDEANIWIDEQISILTTGYGLWGNLESESIALTEGDTYESHC